MHTQYVSPKLLLQFYKGERVPPLAVKHEKPQNLNEGIIEQRKNQYNHFAQPYKLQRHNDNHSNSDEPSRDVEEELQKQIEQNRELRQIIKQLEQNLERLKQVNEQLIVRVEDLEKRNNSLNEASNSIKKDAHRKARVEVYKQVQDYLRLWVEKFTQEMHSEKITPQCENKIQSFLQQVLNINNLSVRKSLHNTAELKKSVFDEQKTDKTINQILMNHSAQRSRQKKRQMERNKYQALLQKLNQTSADPKFGQIVTRSKNSPSKGASDGRTKRAKIFSNSKRSGEQSSSPDHKRRLDF